MPILSVELYKRLFQALDEFREFDNYQRLCEFIACGKLAVYQQWFLENVCKGKAERIEKTINYLRRQRLRGEQLALPLLLMELRSTLVEGDALLGELEELVREVTSELEERDSPPRMNGAVLTASSATMATSRLLNDHRKWIIEFVNTIIDPMGPAGRKNLLRSCDFPDHVIDSIDYNKQGTYTIAEEMVGLVESRDKLKSDICYLEVFLTSIMETDLSIGGIPKNTLLNIITDYKQARTQVFESITPYNGITQHQSTLLGERQIYDEYVMQSLKQAREQPQTNPAQSLYKIDAGTLIQCNLHEQKACFRLGFDGRYKGAFTFTVAGIDREILREYVIEGLIWELKQHIKRPIAPVRHVYLDQDKLNCSSLEQGVISLQKEIEKQLSIQSFTDLLSEDQETTVVVIWPLGIPLDSLRYFAQQFSETLKKSVKDILHQQGRCLVLFWATDGTKSLDIPVALPIFERFDINHLSEWVEYEVSNQLRRQDIPEQEIRHCWERIVTKITGYEGRLPVTYYILRDHWN